MRPKYRHRLPQLDGGLFLTDGGLETTLIFHDGWQLPMFESFVLIESARGRAALEAYFDRYLPLAQEHRTGFVLESPTWRANPDWALKAGIGRDRLAAMNRDLIALMVGIRSRYEMAAGPIVISGCVGPRGDGYDAGRPMGVDEAEAYHGWQICILADTAADLVSAITMTNVPEAIGIARAARAADLPSVISFTLETDGRLPAGDMLGEAIEAVDAATGGAPAYYMINCAHPMHFERVLAEGGAWTRRLAGLRANASRKSHAELDEATELDSGDPEELGRAYAAIRRRLPQIRVLGGCCGTDHRHVAAIGASCAHMGANAAA